MYLMQPYDDALTEILEFGVKKSSKRTGVSTIYVPSMMCRYRLESFHYAGDTVQGRLPVLTRRQVYPTSIIKELLWFISGSTNNNDLVAMGCKIWSPWVNKAFEEKHGYVDGALGPIYGHQLRHFGANYGNGSGENYNGLLGDSGFDQLAYMMGRIQDDPSCRRILFSLWNPTDLPKMALAPCHYTYQVTIDDDGRLVGHLTQRSADFPIGVPANIQFYSLLTVMIAQQTGYKAHELVHHTIDSHIYADQIEVMRDYLHLPTYDQPVITIKKARDIYSYKPSDFKIEGYIHGPKLNIPVAV